jgi:hypothetical protein
MRIKILGFILTLAAITVIMVAVLSILSPNTYTHATTKPDIAIPESVATVFTYQTYLPTLANGPTHFYFPVVANAYPTPENVFGVEIDGGLPTMQAIGSMWIHAEALLWSSIEPAEGTLKWSAATLIDKLLAQASTSFMRPILIVNSAPGWAQQYPPFACGPISPTKYEAFGNFMYEVVSRYSGPPYNVQYYELGNEPDVDRSWFVNDPNSWWGCWGDNNNTYYGGSVYADMLKVVYPRIKEANPSAQVLIGGLLLDCDPRIPLTNDPGNGFGCRVASRLKPPRFLEGILHHNGANDGASYFDGVSYHSYEFGQNVQYASEDTFSTTVVRNGPSFLAKAAYIRTILNQYGASDKFLMTTEGALLCSYCTYTDTLNETSKALYAAIVFPAAMANNIKGYIWYSVMGWPGQNTAILNSDMTPRQIYTALLVSRTQLRNATYQRLIVPVDIGGAPGVNGYSFLRNGRQLWTLWNYDGNSYVATLPGIGYSVMDYMGNSVQVSPSGTLTIGLQNTPFVYVEWSQ